MPPPSIANSTTPDSSLKGAGLTGVESTDTKPATTSNTIKSKCITVGKDGDQVTSSLNGTMAEPNKISDESMPPENYIGRDSGKANLGSAFDDASKKDADAPTQRIEQLSLSSKPAAGNASGLRIYTNADSLPPTPPQKDSTYIDPTPKTPQAPPSPSPVFADKDLPEVPPEAQQNDEGGKQADIEAEGRKSEDSQSEIQSIMEQFADETTSLRQEEIMSPRLELAAHPSFPPRKSSLEPIKPLENTADQSSSSHQTRRSSILVGQSRRSLSPPAVPPKSPPNAPRKASVGEQIETSVAHTARPPPPEPEPDQPFDFHRFLEQLRHRTADPVAKFLRSFLTEFGKRQWMVHEQVKVISDFLAFITNKMAMCDVWKEVSDVEFDNAKEGMEKLVMNRLYSQTFSPAIPPPPALPRSRSRGRRKDLEKHLGPGRRGQHQEDVERDEILAQKIRIYGWVREEHLDIPPVGSNGHRFLVLAQQELLKIKGYRAPRDKVICILNCCKVIFGLLKNSKNSDTSADSFMPLLIYVVLKANPEHLVSNLQYILRFRNQEKLGGEAGYYLSSLSGAIQFVETLDQTSLTVSQEEFDRNVEKAVSAIAEKNKEAERLLSPATEKSAASRETTPRSSMEQGSRSAIGPYVSNPEDNPPMAGLLRTIQKPLTTIGRIFSDDGDSQQQQQRVPPQQSAALPSVPQQQCDSSGPRNLERQPNRNDIPTEQHRSKFEAQEAAARQASAEAAEAHRIQRAEHAVVVETLSGMFPNLDKDVIDDVVRMKEGRVGLAVDACLALSTE